LREHNTASHPLCGGYSDLNAEADHLIIFELSAHEIQLQATWAATSKHIYSLYSAVSNTGTLTVAPFPRISEVIQPGSNRPSTINSVQDILNWLYEEVAATCFKRNSRSSTGQVDITFWWKSSGSDSFSIPVTYRGPVKGVVELYRKGIVAHGDLEKAGIADYCRSSLPPDPNHPG
jgi:hypothetical protein